MTGVTVEVVIPILASFGEQTHPFTFRYTYPTAAPTNQTHPHTHHTQTNQNQASDSSPWSAPASSCRAG